MKLDGIAERLAQAYRALVLSESLINQISRSERETFERLRASHDAMEGARRVLARPGSRAADGDGQSADPACTGTGESEREA